MRIFFLVFRVKNHDFTPKKIIFFPIAEGGPKIVGVFRVKNHDFTPKNHIFSNFRVGARRVRPPWIRPCIRSIDFVSFYTFFIGFSNFSDSMIFVVFCFINKFL